MNAHDIQRLLTAMTDHATPAVDLTEVGLRFSITEDGRRRSPVTGGLLERRLAPPLLVSVPDALEHLQELERDAAKLARSAQLVRERLAAALADIPEEG